MKLHFLADANLKPAIVTGVTRLNALIDFADAQVLPPGMPDLAVLRLAADAGRVLVTHDVRTMQVHLAEFVRASGDSPGVILIPQSMEVGAAVRDLVLLWELLEEWELRNQICRLPGLAVFYP